MMMYHNINHELQKQLVHRIYHIGYQRIQLDVFQRFSHILVLTMQRLYYIFESNNILELFDSNH
jgi:hypothetical protein